MTPDRFGAAAIRERVLAAWAASPARFREDANAEEDLALGWYRDRLIVELAQNAADAAARAGVPGRLLLALRELDGRAVLVAANTGAPLDDAGVQALCTLRASAKRDGDSVGRFGVGFSAVLAVTDEPAVVSRGGGVRFAAADTRELVRQAATQSPGLADELTRRDGHVPVLRLPFETEGTPPTGYDTAVLLPLRDAAAEDLVQRLLEQIADPLLLALPGLDEISIEHPEHEPHTLRDAASRWHALRRQGRLDPALLADRPTEEHARTGWQITWAVPRGVAPSGLGVVHAPTPSDEPFPWPALLIATFPLDPARRHVAAGPATDALVSEAADAYAELLVERAEAGDDVLPLVPAGLAAGALDGALRAAVLQRLPRAPVLHAAEDATVRVRPRDAVALEQPAGSDPAVVAALAPWIADLVAAPRAATAALTVLGVRRLGLAELVDSLPAAPDPRRWREVYRALEPLAADPLARESLAALPVPLADGRVVRGVRGVVLADAPDGEAVGRALARLGVRTVHPQAAHPLLERLGALPAGPRAILDLPAVRAAVENSAAALAEDDATAFAEDDVEDDSPSGVADAVLGLVAAAVGRGELAAGDLAWLGDLALLDEDGELAPASTLAAAGSRAAQIFDPNEIGLVSRDLAERWGLPVLAAVGVLTGPAPVRAEEVPLDADWDEEPIAGLEGWSEWVARVREDVIAAGADPAMATIPELTAVRDLDVVRDDALPDAVALIAQDAVLRPALVRPVRVAVGGRAIDVVPYTAWWLRERLGADALADPHGDPELGVLLPSAPEWVTRLDPQTRHALGVVAGVRDLDAAALPAVLDRLADPQLPVSGVLLMRLLRRIAEMAAAAPGVDPPQAVRVPISDGRTAVVPAADAVVADAPMYRQRTDLGAIMPAPPELASALADLLDVPLASEVAPGRVSGDGTGTRAEVPAAVAALLPEAPRMWIEHDALAVDGVEVAWWVHGDGRDAEVHAATVEGLARGLAWAGGRWQLRDVVADVLADPGSAWEVLADEAFSLD